MEVRSLFISEIPISQSDAASRSPNPWVPHYFASPLMHLINARDVARSRSGGAFGAIDAALVMTTTIAGDQQKSMLAAIGDRSEATDFSAVVDEERFIQDQVVTLRHKIVQVQNLAVLPQNSMFNWISAIGEEVRNVKARPANNLAPGIDRIRGTAPIAWQGTEVRNLPMPPKECD